MNLNIKRKFNAVADHVRSNAIPYAAGLAVASSIAARYVYDHYKGMIYLDDLIKVLSETEKAGYFRDPKTGITVLTALYDSETMKDLKFLD